MDLLQRPRRLRRGEAVRRLCRETRLSADSLIYPIFFDETLKGTRPIESLPGQLHCRGSRHSLTSGPAPGQQKDQAHRRRSQSRHCRTYFLFLFHNSTP